MRESCAAALAAAAPRVGELSAFVGFDGFVDEIVHAVDKRENAEVYTRLPTIRSFADRVAAAAGKSTNIEMVNQRTKLGGNGPIMANAMASLGVKVTYVGALGYPNIHPVFQSFTTRANVHSISEAGHTDALEFEDGKVMLVKSAPLNDVTWANIQSRFGRDKFEAQFSGADLVGFVNWTMIPYMSDFWEAIAAEICPRLGGRRRTIFFDLADPQKRPAADIARALELISKFQAFFDVIFGMNEKESVEVGEVIGIPIPERTPEGLSELGRQINARLKLDTVVIHPVTYALATSRGAVDVVEGPVIRKPLITTGAGDHFNSGFCLGKLLGLDNARSLLAGVTTSGFYVRTGQSPTVADLAGMMRDWPVG